ncbi:MAG: carbohydrate ABC transporter permease [Clostridia bacterium]|nr:carbohydrate ABC transporter permease [Clostridia bacterium]MBQ6937751.1 carbohydrate ABC transporter permease [Clostridia bacterium]MBR2884939.1 carbohydrate ABC transporter permease [Clostridia bacterium]
MIKKIKGKQLGLNLFFTVLSLTFIIPFLILIAVSLSNEQDVWQYGYRLVPKRFDLTAYKWVFRNPGQILQAYKVTATFSILHMITTVFVTLLAAYPLSRKEFKYRNIITGLMFFTLLFSAGTVPKYIWNTQFLNLGNTIWIYVLPGTLQVWNVFMIRTFMQGIPYELTEAAIIDGAGEWSVFLRIMIPLTKPGIATIALLTFLGSWNNWMTSLLYITKDELVSLQYFLQRILEEAEFLRENEAASQLMGGNDIPSETVRFAMAITVAGPALFVFPFFQKYFVKGITIGGVKG